MKKGSALLIVLGMMGFIMVSALAFSAYMRYARLPSSYLRRTVSARQLVKAGLANAINEIDSAIGNHPHPGVGGQQDTNSVNSAFFNTWCHRVFIGTQLCNTQEIQPSETVPSLCMEALAYIPPPLVNEARYYSRRSALGRWRPLEFDVGRYNFCALDVSDYFDVNRLVSGYGRNSSPQRRVSLAYLFEDMDHRNLDSAAAAQWDTFMEKFRTFDPDTLTVSFDDSGKYPLVSLADFNLALGEKGMIGKFKSPFYDYLTGSGSRAGFYNTASLEDEEYCRRMTFVTDGLFPLEEKTDEQGNKRDLFELDKGEGQPFDAAFLEEDKPAPDGAILGRRLLDGAKNEWMDVLGMLGCGALYDYLDPDRVPLSLGIPTTERVPMICGISTLFNGGKFGVTKKLDPVDGQGNPDPKEIARDDQAGKRTVEQTVIYRIDRQQFTAGFQMGNISTLAVYPFTHRRPDDGSFKLDGRFSLFLNSGTPKLRTAPMGETGTDSLHLMTPVIEGAGIDGNTGLISAKLIEEPLPLPTSIEEERDAVIAADLPLANAAAAIGDALEESGNELLRVKYQWEQSHPVVGGVLAPNSWEPSFDDVFKLGGKYIVEAHCGIPASKWNDRMCTGLETDMAQDAKLLTKLKEGNDSGFELNLKAAVWLRIRDENNRVVDMVPACMADDRTQNGIADNYPLMQVLASASLGAPYPLMLFGTDVAFKYSINGLEALLAQPQDIKISPSTAIVADPRYNHAPEHWFKMDQALNAENWCKSNLTGSGDRDGDIMMATSDAGYLQSPYELAFLPRFTDLKARDGDFGFYRPPDNASRTEIPASAGLAANQDVMWRTYDPFDIDSAAFEDLQWTSEGTGFKINPYSDSTNVLMAVFANTPLDWHCASTNDQGQVDFAALDVDQFNSKYAMNEYSSDTKLGWHDLERVAGTFIDSVRREGVTDWRDAWLDLNWPFDKNNPDRFLCDGDLVNSDRLWTADRKFLFGFWRDCFAVRQQLFLVFVRAEPVMLGSEAVGRTPPQLGARAVALVWRDPRATKTDANQAGGSSPRPHRTRVLFYRQFD